MANFRTIGTDFSEGVRTPYYTNGRLLTAEDLQEEQRYQVERHAHLGQAAGYGIVEGFNVTTAAGSTALTITAGMGINRHGDVIHMAADKVTLPVQPIAVDMATLHRSSRFEVCEPAGPQTPAAVTSGAYLLTARPSAQLEGFVPRKACDGTKTSTCANQWEVEGVEFRIVRLDKYKSPTGSQVNRNRNLLAHWFYGSDDIINLMRDPLQFPANYSGFSEIAAVDFNECDLPLAVFNWAGSKISFVDEWSVRRRPVHAYPGNQWAANISDQRTAEGQARFLQFQEHAADLQVQFGSKTRSVKAVDRFAYLPPAGILPVNPFELVVADIFDERILERQLAEIEERGLEKSEVLEQVRAGVLGSLGSENAYNLDVFFGNLLAPDYQIVHEDYIHDRLHQSWIQPPILLPPPVQIEFGFFELISLDGARFQVAEDNFADILGLITNNFDEAVYTPPTIKSATISPDLVSDAASPPVEAIGRLNLNIAAGIVKEHYKFRPPAEIFIPPVGDVDEEVEPLIDIFVVDELLDPYRDQLGSQMVSRIDDAIVTLSGTGGIFVGGNLFTDLNKMVRNAFALNNFMWKAANFGFVEIGDLIPKIKKITLPDFYVVFARHRPRVVSRPLRLL